MLNFKLFPQTSLNSLGLKSLKRVNSGAIVIVENKHLCFASEIDWAKIKKSKDHEVVVTKNKLGTECGELSFFY
jgi:epidermal growth factor receptor